MVVCRVLGAPTLVQLGIYINDFYDISEQTMVRFTAATSRVFAGERCQEKHNSKCITAATEGIDDSISLSTTAGPLLVVGFDYVSTEMKATGLTTSGKNC